MVTSWRRAVPRKILMSPYPNGIPPTSESRVSYYPNGNLPTARSAAKMFEVPPLSRWYPPYMGGRGGTIRVGGVT